LARQILSLKSAIQIAGGIPVAALNYDIAHFKAAEMARI
jgi:hypothetical protein